MNKEKTESGLRFMFDSYCKKVVKYNGCAMRRNEKRVERKILDCIAFDEAILNTLYVEDQYNILASKICLPNISVYIENESLYHYLLLLPKKKLEIILLSYFGEMTDNEIGKMMSIAKSTVQYNRIKALGFLKDNMKESAFFHEK